jgi:glycosyltransferase involved in cell wall biosynthesis
MSSPAVFDVFVDVSGAKLDCEALEAYLDRLVSDGRLAGAAGRVTLAGVCEAAPLRVPPGLCVDVNASPSPTAVLSRSLKRAAIEHRHLVVLLAPIVPTIEELCELIQVFDRDPMFGSAQPRFVQAGTDEIWPLPGGTDRDWPGSMISRGGLRSTPDISIAPELLAACIVLRWTALAATDELDEDYGGLDGALLHFLCQTRRRGLRAVIVNRTLVSSALGYADVYPVPVEADRERLKLKYPDHDLAETEIRDLLQRHLEVLLSVARVDLRRQRILVDCWGLPPRHNGSAQWVLGCLDGLATLGRPEQIDILVWPHIAKFHRLSQRYPRFRQVVDKNLGPYAAAVSLTQPWDLKTLRVLHRHALVLAVTMLDTIAWDVLYPDGADRLGTIWRFVARHVDGVLYNSSFTRERFTTRFPLEPGIFEQVTHHSLTVQEHIHPSAAAESVSDYILVFGNEYEHKDLRPTLQILVDAFPFNPIVAFGIREAFVAPNVRVIPSGELDQLELHRLIAGARVIVFPSYYEGFGLPVVEGLAYGRPVVARRSALWAEISGWSRLPGQLFEFDDPPSLVETVGQVLAGRSESGLAFGAHLGEAEPATWRDCAERVMDLVQTCLATSDGCRWRAREDALNLVGF